MFKRFTFILFVTLSICASTSAAQIARKIVVDKDGSGDFVSLQKAVDAVRAFDPKGRTSIFVKKGIYHEKIVIPAYVCNVEIVGEERDSTIILYEDHAKMNDMGTFRTYTMLVRGNDILIKNLTIKNGAEPVAQAVALHTEGNRLQFVNCNFLGNQDTLYLGGEDNKLYFLNCYTEGTTDFIFGGATCWFETCEIHGKKNSYITAASTPKHVNYGFVFNACKITVAENVTSVFLGRPWRPFAMTVFMNCDLPKEIDSSGWDNWRNPENEKTARYAEFNNRGAGSSTLERVKWMKVLTSKEAERIKPTTVIGDWIY